MDLISRKEAKAQGLKHYFTGHPCNRGHLDERLVSSTTCCECVRENHYTWYGKNREQALSIIKQWSARNGDSVVEASRRYRANNPGADAANAKKYYDANKEIKLKYNRWWRNMNKAKLQQYNAARRASIRRAMPAWADVDKILAVYKQSASLSQSTGTTYHVDHIIPLSHALVCGLHVHENLQVLVGADNMSKSNKFTVE